MYEFLLVFGVVLWVGVGIAYLRHPASSAFHPLTWYLFVHGLIFVIRPIFAWFHGFDGIYLAYRFTPSLAEKGTALAAADLGLVAFAGLSLRVGNVPWTPARPFAHPTARGAAIRSLGVAAALCLPIAAYSVLLQALGQGSVTELAEEGVFVTVAGSGYLSDAALMAGPICVMAAWLFRFRALALVPFAVFVAVRLGIPTRGPMVVGFLLLFLFFLHHRRRRWPSAAMVIPLLIAVALFRVVGDNRTVFRDWALGTTATLAVVRTEDHPLESMDFANMEFLEYLTYAIPHRTGTHGWFLDNLQLFTEPVPRALWPGKPVGAPIQPYRLFDHGYPIGMTFSVPGEGWAQGGWFGVALWSGLFGAFYGWMYRVFARGRQGWFATAVYVTILSATVIVFRDGVLLTIAKLMAAMLLPVLAMRGAAYLFFGHAPAPLKPAAEPG